jgi:uncharacterized surface protein with fasciclin (FAS1) repeats
MLSQRFFRYALFVVLATSAIGAQASGFGTFFQCKRTAIIDVPDGTPLTAAAESLGLTGLVDLIDGAGIADDLDSASGITVFAPGNDAIDALLAGVTPQSNDVLVAILQYHVVPRPFDPRQVAYIRKVPTLLGQDLFVSRSRNGPDVNQSNVVDCQGYRSDAWLVWVIDSVLLPQF